MLAGSKAVVQPGEELSEIEKKGLEGDGIGNVAHDWMCSISISHLIPHSLTVVGESH